MILAGIDLAWGDRNSDGICFLNYVDGRARVLSHEYSHGNEKLLALIHLHVPSGTPAFLAIDAPLVCPNQTGSRSVDKEISKLFWRQEAGCYPANADKCKRPLTLAKKLLAEGFTLDYRYDEKSRLACEVYPHPAMVRLFGLEKTIKYKKKKQGRNVQQREFGHYQKLTAGFIKSKLPLLELGDKTKALLNAPWSKRAEDEMDGFFCALIALWHVHNRGSLTTSVGSLEEGFILLPRQQLP